MGKLASLTILLLCSSFPSFAQYFTTTQTVTLAAAAAVVTVQQPSAPTRVTKFNAAVISCTVACTFTLERNGTAATSTSNPTTAVNPSEGTAQNLAWNTSNVGTGTVIGNYQISGGGTQVLDLSQILFGAIGKGQNVTIRTNSITGSVAIVILWQEL